MLTSLDRQCIIWWSELIVFMENVEIQHIGVESDIRKYLRLMEAIIGGDV